MGSSRDFAELHGTLRADAMFPEPVADDVVFGAREVLADIAQEMEMADEVRQAGKDFGDRLEDAPAHVVNQRQGNAECAFDALRERHDVFLVLRGQLDIAKNDF